ncbi:glycosyltransferase [Aquihabitans sp. McL0605]|uniref:glycosyltransferase n=1 Tax=Aquihabitans sp. McL0605 TaxID=3415671 RepID=UPI003CEDCDA6
MRILIAAWRDLANDLAGGSEVLIDHLCKGMTARGHDVTLLCANPVGEGHGYRVHPNGGTVDQYLRAPFAYLRHFRDADLVVDVANGVSFYAPAWRRGPSLCLVNHIHTEQWDQWFNWPVAPLGRLAERKLMPAVYRDHLFVAVSPSTADLLEELGVDRDRIRIIINGTELPATIGHEAPEPLFVGLGRLVPHKRFELAVEAFNQIQPIIGGRLVIAGDGPERDRLLEMAGPGVEIPGRISEQEKQELLSNAWLMVHPASHEGWGLVITEAAAYGAPALAFRVPGLQDSIVDGMSGVLVDRPEQLAETWLKIAQDKPLRDRLRTGALRRAAACSWDATVDRFEEICEEAVQSHKRSLQLPPGSWTGPDERVPVGEYGDADTPVIDSPELAGIPTGTGRQGLQVVRDRPDLTIVLPAFNEAARLPISLPVLAEFLAGQSLRTEVIIVDDGSTDDTVRIGTELLREIPRSGVFKLGRHGGKGAAVRAGVARATGHNIVFMDADMATDLEFLEPLLTALDDVHVAIGSRSAPGAITSGITPSSDAAHRMFNVLARSATGLAITDFQCGFKGFRAATGKLLFHLMRERGYAFDVELLALADRIGFDLREVPVHWRAVRGSHVRIVVDSLHMTYQIARISRRVRYPQTISALEAYGRSPDLSTADLARAVDAELPVPGAVVPWDKGVLVLLPFVEPVDATQLATALERNLDGILVRPTAIDAAAILDPQGHRLRAGLALP